MHVVEKSINVVERYTSAINGLFVLLLLWCIQNIHNVMIEIYEPSGTPSQNLSTASEIVYTVLQPL